MVAAGLLLLSTSSCKKTIVNPLPSQPDDRILEYKITNVQGSPIYGAVDDSKKTITVVIPAYLQLVTLQPEIKITDGATVSPASNALVQNIPEVFLKKREVSYTVKGKSGLNSTYKLELKVQQVDFKINELSTDPASSSTYTKVANSTLTFYLTGSGFSENNDLMRAELLNLNGEAIGDLGISAGVINTTSKPIYLDDALLAKFKTPLPATGQYRIKIYNYAKEATLINPIIIKKQ
jgi:hypothetical protein